MGALQQTPQWCALSEVWCPIEAQRKLAVVIGNSDYAKARLKNPVNDAVAMEPEDGFQLARELALVPSYVIWRGRLQMWRARNGKN
jgi:hypothetical protein